MKNIRIIPRLDIKGPNVVKPVQTEALRVVGNPKILAEKYYHDGADELLYMDIVASLYQRNLDFDLLRRVTENIFIPVTVGGGIRSIQDIATVLRSGADKVAINTFAVHHPEFLVQAVRQFGAQCIVLSIEAKKQTNGTWEAFTDGGRERTGKDAVVWAKEAIELGVGEILLTSIDRDGTRLGYDQELISAIASFATVPIIAYGGASAPQDLRLALQNGVDAVAASSIFHYNNYSIVDIKKDLASHSINVRIL